MSDALPARRVVIWLTDGIANGWHSAAMIEFCGLRLLRIPLRTPYKLAFGPVTHFDTIMASIIVKDREGFGEATILTGYTEETVEESWARACSTSAQLPGRGLEAAKSIITREMADLPFAATALTTAIEMAEGHPALMVREPALVPLLAGLNGVDRSEIADEIEQAMATGYGTLKIKVGFNVERDLERVNFIQQVNAGRARLRIDANQGYSREDACHFATTLNPSSVELLEQPCHAADWSSLEAVAKVTNVPLMLDESIYSEHDIERAAAIGASFVKLKLMKFVSLDRLERALTRIRDLGMEPILGNGVAGDLGCWMEACVARRQIRNAGEMNGFLRPSEPLAPGQLRVQSGALVVNPGGAPRLDAAALDRVAVAAVHFGTAGQLTALNQ